MATSTLEQRLNPLTGESEWVIIKDENDDDDDLDVLKGRGGSLAHTQYLDMLNDELRNRAYDEAITKAVGEGAQHVLDIGAGTGLLSMMAARASQQNGETSESSMRVKITACESYLPMVRLARRLLKANAMEKTVRLIHKRSDDMEIGVDLTSPADVLISEILDSELLGEGLIPTLRHAHTHLLKPGVRSVPHRARIFAQLVESNYLWRSNNLAEVEAYLDDGIRLGMPRLNEKFSGMAGTMHVDALVDHLKLLSEPFEVFSFEFSEKPACNRMRELHVPIKDSGQVHALISWWVLDLDKEGTITYSTAPDWTRANTGRGVRVLPGEVANVEAIHDEISVKYELVLPRRTDPIGLATETALSNLVLRPERIGILGDQGYRRIIREAVLEAVREKSSPLCLVVDDSILCTVSAAAAKSSAHVIAMLPGLQHKGGLYIQEAACANGLSANQIEVLGRKATYLTSGLLKGRKVDVLIAEPYYKAYEDLLPWRHLRFWYERTSLASLLVEEPTIIPCQGLLRGVALSIPDLWHSRKSLSHVEGFDHSSVNEFLGACGELSMPSEGPLLPYSIWQCGQSKWLTDPFTIMKFDFNLPMHSVEGSVKTPILISGVCHGIALWIDWVMDAHHDLVLRTGPTTGNEPNYWKQGVKLLSVPMQLSAQKNSRLKISALFDSSTGDITVLLPS